MINDKFKVIKELGKHHFIARFENDAVYEFNKGKWTYKGVWNG